MTSRTEPSLPIEAFALLDDAAIVTDDSLRVISWNEAAGRLFGLSAESAIGRSCIELVGIEETNLSWDELCARARGVGKWRGDVLLRSKADRQVWVDLSLLHLARHDSFVLVARDIGGRKQLEDRLYDLDQAFGAFLRQCSEGLCILDGEGRVVEWNPAVAWMSGIPRETALGAFFWDLQMQLAAQDRRHEGLTEALKARVLRGLRGETSLFTAPIEFRYQRPGEPVRLAVQTTFPINGRGGLRFGSIARDITEQRRAQEELRDRDWVYRFAMEHTGQLVYDYDLASGKIRWAGDTRAVTGHSYEEFQHVDLATWEAWIHPEDRAEAVGLLEAARRGDKKYYAEYRFRCKDGSYAYVEDSGSFLGDAHTAAERMVGSMKNINERRRAEQERERLSEQLRQAQKMESIGRLAGGVAHDFNNILTAIYGRTELVLLSLAEGSPLRTPCTEIRNAVDSAAALTRQLLAFSRKQFIQPQLLDLNTLIDSTRRMLERLIGEDVEMRVTPEQGLWKVKADPSQIEQILVNLAVNARDAMPQGGRLTLATVNLTLDGVYARTHSGVTPGPYVMLSVSDTGTGMSEDVKSHLFEPFFTTKGKSKGTGLGLATVYGAVKQNGGTIEVYSELGHGTVFKIFFPRGEGEPEAAELSSPSDEALPHGRETILLVEDEKSVRDMATETLRHLGYTVLSCATPDQAIETARTYADAIELLLTDVVMPHMNGKALATEITGLRPEIRVLFTSGYTQDIIVHHGVLEKEIQFLAKPYTLESLAKKVRSVLSCGLGPASTSSAS